MPPQSGEPQASDESVTKWIWEPQYLMNAGNFVWNEIEPPKAGPKGENHGRFS